MFSEMSCRFFLMRAFVSSDYTAGIIFNDIILLARTGMGTVIKKKGLN